MTRDGFHRELRELEEAVIQLGTLVENEIAQAMQALTRREAVIA